MKELAFAINCYDKINEVEILVDILRHMYGKQTYIYVTCSNNKAPKAQFEHLDIDFLELGEPIEMLPKEHPRAATFNAQLMQLRRMNQFARGVRHCAEHSGKPYVVTLHADAWPLSRAGLDSIIAAMEQQQKWFGSYYYGIAYADPVKLPESCLTDIFFVARSDIVRERRVFDYTHAEYLCFYTNIHSYIANAVKYTCGMNSIYAISYHLDAVGWDGTPKRVAPSVAMLPLHFIPSLGLLHFGEACFLSGWCYALLSNYLVDYGFKELPSVKRHLAKYPADAGHKDQYLLRLKERYGDRILDARYLCDATTAELDNAHKSLVASGGRIEPGKPPSSLQPLNPMLVRYLENCEFMGVVADQINGGKPFDALYSYKITKDGFRGRS